MPPYRPRIPTRFSNYLDTESVSFPTADYAYELDQGLHVGHAYMAGAHGALDLLGLGSAIKQPGLVRIGCRVYEDSPETVDTTFHDILDKTWRFGLGALWTSGLVSGVETERWTRARLLEMPRQSWAAGDILSKELSLAFICPLAQWFDENQLATAGDHAIAASPTTIVVNNTGNDRIYDAILTLRGTYTDPVIENLTNGYKLQSNRDGTSTDHRLRFDAGRMAVEFSSDAGVTYAGDWANNVRQVGQAHLMILEKGNNSIRVTGCTSGTLNVQAYGAWHY